MKSFCIRVLLSAVFSLPLSFNGPVPAKAEEPFPLLFHQNRQEEVLVAAQPGKMVQLKDVRAFRVKMREKMEEHMHKPLSANIFPREAVEPKDMEARHIFYCAAFVQQLYRQCGIWIPAHTASTLPRYGVRLTDIQKLQTGDLVFYSIKEQPKESLHVAVYAEDGIVFHPDQHWLRLSFLSQRSRFLFATRIVH